MYDPDVKCVASVGVYFYFGDAKFHSALHAVVIVTVELGMGIAQQQFDLRGAGFAVAAFFLGDNGFQFAGTAMWPTANRSGTLNCIGSKPMRSGV